MSFLCNCNDTNKLIFSNDLLLCCSKCNRLVIHELHTTQITWLIDNLKLVLIKQKEQDEALLASIKQLRTSEQNKDKLEGLLYKFYRKKHYEKNYDAVDSCPACHENINIIPPTNSSIFTINCPSCRSCYPIAHWML